MKDAEWYSWLRKGLEALGKQACEACGKRMVRVSVEVTDGAMRGLWIGCRKCGQTIFMELGDGDDVGRGG